MSLQPLKLQERWTLKSTHKFRKMSWKQSSRHLSQLTRQYKANKSRNTANEVYVYQNSKKIISNRKNYNRIVSHKGNLPHSLKFNDINLNKGSVLHEFKTSKQNESSKQCIMNSTKNIIKHCNQTQILKIFGNSKEKMNQNKIISYGIKSLKTQKSNRRIVFIVSPVVRASDLSSFQNLFTRNGSHALLVSIIFRLKNINYTETSSKHTFNQFSSKLKHAKRKNKTNFYSSYEIEMHFDRNPQLKMFNHNVVAISAIKFTIPFTND